MLELVLFEAVPNFISPIPKLIQQKFQEFQTKSLAEKHCSFVREDPFLVDKMSRLVSNVMANHISNHHDVKNKMNVGH